jgi:hypothetical protein
MTSMRRRASTACLLVLGYVALTCLFTYPLFLELGTHHVGDARGDAKGYLWNYWWTKTALERGTSPFETDAIFHPIGIGLAFHTLGFLQGVEFIPLSYAVSEVAAANLVVLWTFPASALATYALARAVGAGVAGSFLAGVVFAFCPYRLARLAGHYDLLGTEWIPLYVLAIWKLAEKERLSVPWVLAAGALAAASGYTASTYLVFLLFFTLLFLAFRPRIVPRAIAVGVVTATLLLPMLHQAYVDRTSWTYEPYPGASRYVADLGAYFTPSPRQSFLGPIAGHAFDPNLTETTVFAGYLVLASALAGLALRRRIPGISFWLASAAVFFVLSLGTTLRAGGVDTGVPLPFALFTRTPVLDELRAPSRFSVMAMLSLAVLLALVWSHVAKGRRREWLLTLFAGAVLVFEYVALPTPRFEAGASPLYRELAKKEEGTLVEIPGIEQAPLQSMYHQTFHRKPIFIGTAARIPREKREYYLGLPLVRPLIDLRKGKIDLGPELIERDRESAPMVARFLGLGYFVIDRGYEKRGVVTYLEQVLPVDRWYEDESVIVLETRREELPPDPRVLEADAPFSRQHFESGFLRAEREGDVSFRWVNRERSTILFRRPSGVRLAILEVAPLDGLPVEVEARLDGRNLGARKLAPGWQETAFPLPAESPEGEVERLSLHWSSLAEASERDPRRLAARVRALRLE